MSIRKVIKKLPVIRTLVRQRDQYLASYEHSQALLSEVTLELQETRQELAAAIANHEELVASWVAAGLPEAPIDRLFVPPGHFYSPIPSLDDVRRGIEKLPSRLPEAIPGIDLRTEHQLELLDELAGYYDEQPFSEQKKEGARYFFDNPAYSYSDAIFLYAMIRHLKPGKIIEVGSGYSSCVILDTNERFFDYGIETTFIEPYPELLLSLLTDGDRDRVNLITGNLQDVDLEVFCQLEPGDILFVDSTHVARFDSDVNYLFFQILPALKPGVYVHFHDIFYPFEYPVPWHEENRAWNELYLLRSFLQYNGSFSIAVFNTYIAGMFQPLLKEKMPLCLKNTGGSIWLQKNR